MLCTWSVLSGMQDREQNPQGCLPGGSSRAGPAPWAGQCVLRTPLATEPAGAVDGGQHRLQKIAIFALMSPHVWITCPPGKGGMGKRCLLLARQGLRLVADAC
ncbi:hypothetical protein GCM10018980_68590 [Streptomyces capoamus]|uniref:Uncharacterized protein n=1 Tax=Streptomyces capoamus TaxID=68183 RepID=A0A919F2N3_9ACTN|nr:hypothetical protein GCM10010501_74800 [Streptomyces libani subsp. rufus]GHG72646.1 hypothetical protein GCM10018980_68590 [Streptomyces capoamus]